MSDDSILVIGGMQGKQLLRSVIRIDSNLKVKQLMELQSARHSIGLANVRGRWVIAVGGVTD
jgi:hypothetical protein